jgi:hypothetical protein
VRFEQLAMHRDALSEKCGWFKVWEGTEEEGGKARRVAFVLFFRAQGVESIQKLLHRGYPVLSFIFNGLPNMHIIPSLHEPKARKKQLTAMTSESCAHGHISTCMHTQEETIGQVSWSKTSFPPRKTPRKTPDHADECCVSSGQKEISW